LITTKFNSNQFLKDMNNMMQYSSGFLEGVQRGKNKMLDRIGEETKRFLADFIDSNARVNPESLHHVYEWYRTGSPEARLFDIDYTVSNLGLSLKSTFRQSTSIKLGSKTPFYDKAKVMESGASIVVRPRSSSVLVFEDDGQQVFTKNPVTVQSPGGPAVAGSFEKVFDLFFSSYFTQSFLKVSGMLDHISNPVAYKKNLPAGKRGGRNLGIATGYRWIANVRTAG
jgi:hypothetical protein